MRGSEAIKQVRGRRKAETSHGLAATRTLVVDRQAMAGIALGRKEARAGQTVSLRDLLKK